METIAVGAAHLLRAQLEGAHFCLERVVDGITTEQAHWSPPGRAMPPGAIVAHVVVFEDLMVNGVLRRDQPLILGAWAGRAGLSEAPPLPGAGGAGLPSWEAWSRRVQLDMAALRAYAQAVYAATDSYLAGLDDEALARELDLSGMGLGTRTLAWTLSRVVLAHADMHAGEIAALKGLIGLQGYPV
jgi:hypothetical protein